MSKRSREVGSLSETHRRALHIGLLDHDAESISENQLRFLSTMIKENDLHFPADIRAAYDNDVRDIAPFRIEAFNRGLRADDSLTMTQETFNQSVARFNEYILLPQTPGIDDMGQIIPAAVMQTNREQQYFRKAFYEVRNIPATEFNPHAAAAIVSDNESENER